jgi:hypothetical protein
MGYQGWYEILMINLIFSKKLGVYKIMRNTVDMYLNKNASSKDLTPFLNGLAKKDPTLLHSCNLLS